jgi:hypothetical protein
VVCSRLQDEREASLHWLEFLYRIKRRAKTMLAAQK